MAHLVIDRRKLLFVDTECTKVTKCNFGGMIKGNKLFHCQVFLIMSDIFSAAAKMVQTGFPSTKDQKERVMNLC